MSIANALYQLQSLDLEISARQARLAEIEAAYGDDRVLRRAQRQVKEVQAALAPQQVQVTNLDLEIKGLDSKTEGAENRLYSGAVTNPKELQDMQEEVASLKRRRAVLEDQMLEVMIAVEEQSAALESAETRLKKLRSRWEADQKALAAEKQALEAELSTLTAERATAWSALDADTQAAYQTLWRRMNGRPVATLNADGVCERCGVAQTTAVVQQVRRGDRKLAYCAGCGRILVAQ